MALTVCRSCGQQVARSAKTCPHCGARDPFGGRRETTSRWVLVLFVGFIAFTGLMYMLSELGV